MISNFIQRFFCTATLLAFAAAPSVAQLAGQEDDAPPADTLAMQRMQSRVGGFANLGLNLHSANFAGIPEAPNCMPLDAANFTGGTSLGIGVGGLYELPLSPQLDISGRIGLQTLGITQTVSANIGPVRQADGTIVEGVSEYSLESSLMMVGATLWAGYRPLEGQPLTVRLGPEFGMMIGKSFTQQEQLAYPSTAAFVGADGGETRIRNQVSADMENVGLRLALALGVDYELPLNNRNTLFLVPELAYALGLGGLRSDLDWSISQLRLGASVKYSLPLPPPPP
ncbi:MAG: hypothetical protein UZ07_CHB004002271, partial [Chlorobi bacterium OLB7]